MLGKKKVNFVGKIEKNDEVVVLVHQSNFFSIAFDVFARKSLKKKKPRLYKKYLLNREYEMEECLFVKEFLKRKRGFEYVFSNDFEHIPYFNCGVLGCLLEIAGKFRIGIIFGELNENEKKKV